MAKLVVNGAKLKCPMGDAEGSLKVSVPCPQAEGGNIAVLTDNIPMNNVAAGPGSPGPFGKCKSLANPTVASATAAAMGALQMMPCVPLIPAPWASTATLVKVGGKPAVLDSSLLVCAWGGTIQVSDPGQKKVEGK